MKNAYFFAALACFGLAALLFSATPAPVQFVVAGQSYAFATTREIALGMTLVGMILNVAGWKMHGGRTKK